MATRKVSVGTSVPHHTAQQIQQLIDEGKYNNSSDFVRTAIREKLNREADPQ
jgi:Arc/MetJ-type ribon-helix-helix transcriptional regulator